MSASSAILQQDRLLKLITPLEPDALLLERMSGASGVSSLFSYHLELLADRQLKKDAGIKPADLVGKPFTALLACYDGKRGVNGVVKEFVELKRDDRFTYYSAEIVPWLWLLTLQADCRVFQDLSTPEIVTTLLDELKAKYPDLVNYETKLLRTYEKWDCCIQYRETDFNFISRLMEHEGIFYFFRHEFQGNGKHTLVIADSPAAFRNLEPQHKFRLEDDKGFAEREDTVHSLAHHVWLQPGKTTLRDHHFELPGRTLETTQTVARPIGGNSGLEIYDYPGDYAQYFNKPSERIAKVNTYGDSICGIRADEEEFSSRLYSGESSCRAFTPGFRMDLDASSSALNQAYVLLSLDETMLQNPSYISRDENSGGYFNRFTCIPVGVPYRPRRLTPKPLISGPQTATVTVKQGEDSWLDKYGRVRLQFHWDRKGKNDENSTCWVRVAQSWAGTRWGAHFWPRVGQEVVVEFLEGDPDKPLVTGSVYNAANMPPYELPQNYTRSGVKTRSSKNGGSSNYNEIRLEDKKDNEQIFINAEKDMDLRVEHDSREFVGNDRHLIVHANQHELVNANKHGHVNQNQYETIDQDMSLQVVQNRMEKIGKDMSLEVGGNRMENVGSDMSMHVGSNRMEEVGSDLSVKVGSNRKEDVGASLSLKVGSSSDNKVGTKYAVEAGQEIHLKAGMKVIIEAGMQLSLKAAGGFVDIGPAGVTIQGILVKINSGGAAGSGSGVSVKSPTTPKAPVAPVAPHDPDTADDGSKGTKM